MPENERAPVKAETVSENRLAVPLETQLELARIKRERAVTRYEISIRRGSAWLDPEEPVRTRPSK